ncbi:phenylalanine--tRNA ligase subunit alpha [Egibacter rhizosphaerae]|uniref:Phenylalanine--tRNA ligase alpha subunit n=1 Tax=Egibacter rhizosphaerae TaxID=1670831 RepID=A0A411YK52_9ACTN|nr:phenylalanine--tRNA ligase subunit alpha [Egibacter rhizosphaerae]QBI21560.1 phenylalanine--tRNA ligase subunit alpha [Egibacter rhizosphaerae]
MTDTATTDEVTRLRDAGLAALRAAGDLDELDAARSAHLGKKSALAQVQRTLGQLDDDQRRELGRAINAAREELAEAEAARRVELEAERDRHQLAAEAVDVTLPPRVPRQGRLHPVQETMEAMLDVLIGLGYRVAEGPEVETDWHNFDALNTPPDHPARSLQDTIYVHPIDGQAQVGEDGSTGILLRTQTSPVQIRTMLAQDPPLYVAMPGRVFRADTTDATHLPMFHQIEGLAVDRDLSFADLKGSLVVAARALLGEDVRLRFRPHFFPFTEPSCELDAWYGGKWMELLGAGMVHPNVLTAGGLDPDAYRGFAWGMGVDRLAMLRHDIGDLRLFVENDLRFLESL